VDPIYSQIEPWTWTYSDKKYEQILSGEGDIVKEHKKTHERTKNSLFNRQCPNPNDFKKIATPFVKTENQNADLC